MVFCGTAKYRLDCQRGVIDEEIEVSLGLNVEQGGSALADGVGNLIIWHRFDVPPILT